MSFINEISKAKQRISTWNVNNPSSITDQIDKIPKYLSICNYNDE
jgi:hypothetical protein